MSVLLVLFTIGEHRYGIDGEEVHAIVPSVPLIELVNTAEAIQGCFKYQGDLIPVIDMGLLTGRAACENKLSTRTILVNFPNTQGEKPWIVGLRAENVVETIEVPKNHFSEVGEHVASAPFLGRVVKNFSPLIQCIKVEEILNETSRDKLFESIQKL